MGEHINIATHAITNSVTGLNMHYLLSDNLLLNSQDKKENGGINNGNDNIFFKEELITMGINLQPKTLDSLILINPNLNLTLPNSHITNTHFTLCRPKPKKAKPNAKNKPNTSSHTSAANDLDLSFHNSANSSSIYKQGSKNVFTSLKLVNKADKKQK